MIRKMIDSDKDSVVPLLIEMYHQHQKEIPTFMPKGDETLRDNILKIWNEILDDKEYFHYVYLENNQIIAYLGLSHKSPYWDFLFPYRKGMVLDTLIVDQNHRGKGIAKKLLEFSKKLSEELNYESLELYVIPEFQKTVEMYKKNGFKHICNYMSYKEE